MTGHPAQGLGIRDTEEHEGHCQAEREERPPEESRHLCRVATDLPGRGEQVGSDYCGAWQEPAYEAFQTISGYLGFISEIIGNH